MQCYYWPLGVVIIWSGFYTADEFNILVKIESNSQGNQKNLKKQQKLEQTLETYNFAKMSENVFA